MSSAGEAVSTPESDGGMTRKGEAPKYRSQAQQGAHNRGRIMEEPCEVETLTHGSEAEAGEVIPSSTVTRLPTAYAPASLPLSAAAERERYRAKNSLAYLAG